MEQEVLAQVIELLSLGLLLRVAFVLVFAWILLRALLLGNKRLIKLYPRYRLQLGQLFPVIRIFIWSLVVAYIVFVIIRPQQAVMFAVVGSLGLAVGLAAQGGMRNLLAGVMMIFNPPFRVGDMVEFGGHYGEVIKLDLSVTWLRTLYDNVVMVPNSMVLENSVANANSGELSEMVVVNIDLPRSVPVREVQALARQAATASPYTFLKKPIVVALELRHDYDFLLRLVIKAYVMDVRFERLHASDVTGRFIDAMHDRSISLAPVPPAVV